MGYELGMIGGFLLFIAKALSSYYLTGGKKGWPTKKLVWLSVATLPLITVNYWFAMIPAFFLYYFLFQITPEEKEMKVREWLYKSNVRKGLIDVVAGWAGAHIISGDSVFALAMMITYTITCMGWIVIEPYCHFPIPRKRRPYGRTYPGY